MDTRLFSHKTPPARRPRATWLPFTDARHAARHGAQVIGACALVALLVSLLHGQAFAKALVFSESIGVIAWLTIEVGLARMAAPGTVGWPRGWRGVTLVVGGCLAGYVGGTALSDQLLGTSSWDAIGQHPRALLGDLGLTAVFSTLILGWFHHRMREQQRNAQVAAARHEATLARLVLLQSQLEPHMLFNTLANLRALIGTDPERAQAMLDRLIDFLRATLVASRADRHPLRDEFARIDDYLALMQVRMGSRLRVATELPAALAALPVPPLLLQPLVENAIKHGLEPQRGPGEIVVRAAQAEHALVLSVLDTGRGLEAAHADGAPAGAGFGLAQVRERLRTLYADAAALTLSAREGGGTQAEIRLPMPDTVPDTAPCA